MKKLVYILLIMSFLIMILNITLLLNYTGYVSQSEGEISFVIESTISCSDGICNGDETCLTCPDDCGSCPVSESPGAGGGGVGTAPTKKDFFVSEKFIKVIAKQGESFKTSIIIRNTEKENQNFKLILSKDLEGILFLSEDSFSLQGGEEKKVYLNFVSDYVSELGVYTGNLGISTNDRKKVVNIIFNVKSKKLLFDIILNVPARYRVLEQGQDLVIDLDLFNLGDFEKASVNVDYLIKDFDGNLVWEESEIIDIEKQISFSKIISLSELILMPGEYVVISQISYDDSIGSSSFVFEIALDLSPAEDKPLSNLLLILIGLLIVAGLILLWLILRRENKKLRRDIKKDLRKDLKKVPVRRKINRRKPGRFRPRIKNIFGKLVALETGFKEGVISKKSYDKGRKALKK